MMSKSWIDIFCAIREWLDALVRKILEQTGISAIPNHPASGTRASRLRTPDPALPIAKAGLFQRFVFDRVLARAWHQAERPKQCLAFQDQINRRERAVGDRFGLQGLHGGPDANITARLALRRTKAVATSRFYSNCCTHARAGHRREHGDLQCGT